MTPAEKAKDLYNKFAVKWHHTTDDVKYYCTTAVDEILIAIDDNSIPVHNGKEWVDANDYYKSVKEEVSKL